MHRLISFLRLGSTKQPAIISSLDYLPDFQNFRYRIALEPVGSRLIAWSKLCECERRLEMYKWVEKQNDPARAQHRILLNDSVSAYLLTFEATIQFVKEQCPHPTSNLSFDKWLADHPQYDLTIRGIRTLRHFEAHVEPQAAPSKIIVIIGGSQLDGTSATTISRTWQLAQLQASDLKKLRNPPLLPMELGDWNNKATTNNIYAIFTDGLQRLKAILDDVETRIGDQLR